MPLEGTIRLGHISDIHYTAGAVWEPEGWDAGVERLNAMDLDAVVISGDFVDWGLRSEWEVIVPKLEEITAPKITCLGNHDARREGWRFYEQFTGRPRFYTEHVKGVDFIVLDSSEPDLDDGEVGREQRAWAAKELERANFPVVVCHHHVVPVPNTGREMNILRDAGGVLQMLDAHNVPLVLGGHRHMPWAWRLNDTLIAHAGTFSSNKRQMPHSFNVVTLARDRLTVDLVHSHSGETRRIAATRVPEKWGGSARDRVEQVHEAGI